MATTGVLIAFVDASQTLALLDILILVVWVTMIMSQCSGRPLVHLAALVKYNSSQLAILQMLQMSLPLMWNRAK